MAVKSDLWNYKFLRFFYPFFNKQHPGQWAWQLSLNSMSRVECMCLKCFVKTQWFQWLFVVTNCIFRRSVLGVQRLGNFWPCKIGSWVIAIIVHNRKLIWSSLLCSWFSSEKSMKKRQNAWLFLVISRQLLPLPSEFSPKTVAIDNVVTFLRW